MLTDKTILIAGAATELGQALAKTYAAQGAEVILVDKTITVLEQLYDSIIAAGQPKPAIVGFDFLGANPENYQELYAAIKQNYSKLDGLIHCPCNFPGLTPIANYEVNKWYNTLQVNLNSAFLLVQTCLDFLKQSDFASIIFTAAEIDATNPAYAGAFAVAKAGVESLTKTLAAELESNTNIRVNCVNPGPLQTKWRKNAFPGTDLSNFAQPELIMPLFLQLMQPSANTINGEILYAQKHIKS